MAEAVRGWLSAWEDVRAGAEEFRELDEERVLVFNDFRGRGKDQWAGDRAGADQGGEPPRS
jgi:hypothetical protein